MKKFVFLLVKGEPRTFFWKGALYLNLKTPPFFPQIGGFLPESQVSNISEGSSIKNFKGGFFGKIIPGKNFGFVFFRIAIQVPFGSSG